MYTVILAVIFGMAVSMATVRALGTGWSVAAGVLALLGFQLAVGLFIRKRINRINDRIRVIMEGAQQKINRQIQQLQRRNSGDYRQAQQLLEREQNGALRESLKTTAEAQPYFKWNVMLKKQICTMQMMLHYQLKEFEAVDRLLPHCVFLDARSIAFKLARMYKHQDPKLDKFFHRKVRRFKNDDAALLYSLYAWIKLRQDDETAALAALVSARKVTDHAVVLENWERLSNNKKKHFSNSGLGDLWYSLYLEDPKLKPQRVQQRMR